MSYTDVFETPTDPGPVRDVDLSGSLGSSLFAQGAEALDPQSGISAVQLWRRARSAVAGGDLVPGLNAPDAPAIPEDLQLGDDFKASVPDTSIADARARVKDEGLDGLLPLPDQPSIKTPVLDLMIQEAQEHRDREVAIARGPHGFFSGALGFATSIGAGIIDPINAAAFSVPVLGEARWGKMLLNAGDSLAARTGVRALQGGLQGAVGTAALQPADWWLHTADGRDYTMADALQSVLMGAGMGAGFHAGFGALRDIRARIGGRPLEGAQTAPAQGAEVPAPVAGEATAAPAGEDVPGIGGERFNAPAVASEANPPVADGVPANAFGETRIVVNGAERPDLIPPHPAEVLADLPPTAREDVARASIADLIDGRPVRAGEMLATAAQFDPRIAESVNARVPVPEDAAPGLPVEASVATVHADILAKLEATGMDRQEAMTHAALFAARYATRAERLEGRGGSAMDLYQREGLNVTPGADGEAPAGRTYAQTEKTQAGDQEVLPGAERISDAELAQRRANEALKPDVAQKPADFGLFGDSDKQVDLLDLIKNPPAKQPRMFEQARTVPTFYSAVGRALDAVKQDKASPEQWRGMLKNAAGVKPEEMKWLGLEDWLKEQKGPVTKQALQDFVRANQIEVREVVKDNIPFANGAVPNGAATKFSGYQLPGGENYRELLLTLPPKAAEVEPAPALHTELPEGYHVIHDQNGKPNEKYGIIPPGQDHARSLVGWHPTPEEATRQGLNHINAQAAQLHNQKVFDAAKEGQFTNSHWEEPNVLAHVRFNDRTIDGKKTLFVEEVQSDWHQKGKRQGYQGQDKAGRSVADVDNDLDANLAELERREPGRPDTDEAWSPDTDGAQRQAWERNPDLHARHDELLRERAAAGGLITGVPDAPFKTTWPELAMKRMIRYAAENGYDKVAWTPGDVQAARYDLSKHVESIDINTRSDGKTRQPAGRSAYIKLPDGHAYSVGVGDDRIIDNVGASNRDWKGKRLDDVLGKDVADKIMSAKNGETLSGLDLKVGGEGMKGFYDQILPATVNKLVKKFGAKVETKIAEPVAREQMPQEIEPGSAEAYEWHADQENHGLYLDERNHEWQVVDGRDDNNVLAVADTEAGAQRVLQEEIAKRAEKPISTHTVAITPELRKAAVEQGFPLFQKGGAGEPRGRITLGENKALIELFAGANKSTFLHETGHLWLDELARDAERADEPAQVKDDMAAVLKWLGVDKVDDIGVKQHEKWARGFERYLAEGKTPSGKLTSAFENFKRWLSTVYQSLSALGRPVSDEVRGVMERLIANDQDIADQRAREARAAANVLPGPGARKGPGGRDPAGFSLLEYLAANGGIRSDEPLIADLRSSIGRDNKFVPGFGNLIRKPAELSTAARMGGRRAPMSLDGARNAAIEGGYLHDEGQIAGDRPDESTINQLLDLVDQELRGNKVYRSGHEPQGLSESDLEQHMAHIEETFDEGLKEAGIDASVVPDSTRARVLQIMAHEGESDPVAALERAYYEEVQDAADEGHTERTAEYVPGWDVPADAGAAPGAGAGVEPFERPVDAGAGSPGDSAGAGDREAADAAWRSLADSGPGRDDPDLATASKEAAATPEPASTDPAKAPSAAEQAAREADKILEDMRPAMSEDERRQIDDALQALDREHEDHAQIIKDGAACLAAAAA